MPKTALWTYLRNPFDNATKRNHKRMYLLATDHFDKLRQKAGEEAELAPLYERAAPAYERFVQLYRKTQTDRALYQMHTARLEAMMKELSSTLARRWDVRIQARYDWNSPEYKALLPRQRRPLQSGAYELRINEAAALADKLANFPDLKDLQIEVADFARRLLDLRSHQQGFEGQGQGNENDLENSRRTLAVAMHAVLGGLIALYADNPTRISAFYELRHLRPNAPKLQAEGLQTVQEIEIPMNKSMAFFPGQLVEGDELKIANLGNTGLVVYTTTDLQALPKEQTQGLPPGKDMLLQVGPKQNTLIVTNESSISPGKVRVELLI